jgi:ABC-type lipoprotein release transport system permease subunit
VSWLPWALALLVAALGAGALAHALVTSVRAHRRDIAVLRTIGFTPRQAGWAIVWEAVALVIVALGLGVPLGVALGRWGWNLLADQIGIPATPAMPIAIAPAVVGAMVVLALVVAAWPGLRASRLAPALALRSE